MPQTVVALIDGEIKVRELPNPQEELMPGVCWGSFDVFYTPANWVVEFWLQNLEENNICLRNGNTLAEEIAMCLLGGHGITAEMNYAAFNRLKDWQLLESPPKEQEELLEALSTPLMVNGRKMRYRFAKQKSRYLYFALRKLSEENPPEDSHRCFRNWLITMPGIGPKTASWITRNWLNSDEVAIIDIHIHRAGILAGFYDAHLNPQRHYDLMEELFLKFATGIGIKTSILDMMMWDKMRKGGDIPLSLLT